MNLQIDIINGELTFVGNFTYEDWELTKKLLDQLFPTMVASLQERKQREIVKRQEALKG